MLNEQGGVIDDLIVYYLNESFYRVVVNASTRDKDLAWMQLQAKDFWSASMSVVIWPWLPCKVRTPVQKLSPY